MTGTYQTFIQRDDSINDHRDDGVVDEIIELLTANEPQSFFLFAGAGSGKTHTLKEILVRLTGRRDVAGRAQGFSQRLAQENRQLAVITYTNNAANEIERRLQSNPLIAVSTIHGFCWRLISGFDKDIRAALVASIDKAIVDTTRNEPGETTDQGRPRPKAVLDRMLKNWQGDLERLQRYRDELGAITRFSYSPDQERFGGGALTHTQVIEVTCWLLENRPTLRKVVIDRHPIIFIDESQDTNKRILHTFLEMERTSPLLLGLIGDHRQRIYMDGEHTLPQIIPPSWARPMLRLNRRCPQRIVELINSIWMAEIDGRTEPPIGGHQFALSSQQAGTIRLYVGEATNANKVAGERLCAEDMAKRIGNSAWNDHAGGYKILVLEHQLAAERGGFGQLYRFLHRYDENRAKDGRIDALGVVRNVLLPLFRAARSDGSVDLILERDALWKHARALSPDRLSRLSAVAQRESFARVLEGARQLRALWNGGDPTLYKLLTEAIRTDLLALDPRLIEALELTPLGEEPTNRTSRPLLLAGALQSPWSEYVAYDQYVSGLIPQGTHQGVKGSEFPRVLVVIDDLAAVGTQFAYDKVFGVKPPSDNDRRNAIDGRETSIDRTLRLLYVTCSRARESLAVVFWTSSPDLVRERMLKLSWFRSDEIQNVT